MTNTQLDRLTREERRETFYDHCCIEARNTAKKVRNSIPNVLKQRQNELRAEMNEKYPNMDRIKKLNSIIEELKRSCKTY